MNFEEWQSFKNLLKSLKVRAKDFSPKIVDRTSAVGEKVWNLQYSPVMNLIYKIILVQLRQEVSCKRKQLPSVEEKLEWSLMLWFDKD